MPTIKIDVHNKLARCADKRAFAVCGNSDYTISFNFDAEWDDYKAKTARFIYNGKYQDVVFTGTECAMPALYGVNSVFIGVYAGDIRTTAPAQLLMVRSIMDGKPKHDEPTADVYNQILALMEAGKIKGDPGEDGFSPTVSVTETDEGTTVTFTDKDGVKVANIKNGKQGDKGDTGATGPAIRIVNYSPIGTTPKDLIADGLDLDFGEDTQAPIVGETVIILWKALVMDSDKSHAYLVYSEIDSIDDDMWGHLSFSWDNIYDITGEDGSDGLPALVCNSAYSSPTYKTLKIGASCQLHAHDFSRNVAAGDVFHLVWKDTGTGRTYIVAAQVISIQEGYVNGKVLSFTDITGKDGADGFSPTATVTQTSTGADVSITDKNGTTNAHIENGSDANVTKENVVSALGYTPLESAPVTSVNGKTGAVEIAASDVGAISSADGSVQNAHLADSSVTTDKLAEAERMTSANITNALGYEPIAVGATALDQFKMTQCNLVEKAGERRATGTTEIYRADSIKISTTGGAYTGLEMKLKDPPIGATINATAARDKGNNWLHRINFLGSNGGKVDGTEHYTSSATLSLTVPAGTAMIMYTIAACWSTALAAGTEVTFSDIRLWYTPDSLLETSDDVKNASYTGEELHLTGGGTSEKTHGCNINLFANFNTTDNPDIDDYYYRMSQGLAMYGGYIFNLCEAESNRCEIQVIDYSTKAVVCATQISPYQLNHQNTGFFSNIFYDSADEFPLLFIARAGNAAYQSGDNLPYDNFGVYRVQRTGSTFTFAYLNHIYIKGTNSFGMNVAWDSVTNRLYAGCPTMGNWQISTSNPIKRWVFNMPSAAEILSGAEINIDISTALATNTHDYYTVQGWVADGGILYEGATYGGSQCILAWDIYTDKLLAKIPMPATGAELEGLSVYSGKLYAVMRTKTYLNIYEIDLG